jgi:hypothetical protein
MIRLDKWKVVDVDRGDILLGQRFVPSFAFDRNPQHGPKGVLTFGESINLLVAQEFLWRNTPALQVKEISNITFKFEGVHGVR